MRIYLVFLMVITLTVHDRVSADTEPTYQQVIKPSKGSESPKRGISFATVGSLSDSACDYDNIQDALDDGETDIRVSWEDAHIETVSYDGFDDITIVGGYLTCASAINGNQDINRYSRIQAPAAANQPVFTITNSTFGGHVYLENIQLEGGSFTGINGGGLSIEGDNVNLTLNRVIIKDSQIIKSGGTGLGGGMAVLGTGINVMMTDVIIEDNLADSGGGIYCTGDTNQLTMSGQSAIRNNLARGINANGGGVHISDGCELTVYSGSEDFSLGIDGNQAARNGGGLYINNATVNLKGNQDCINGLCLGNNTEPVNLSRNKKIFDITEQAGRGGGAYVTNGVLFITAGLVAENSTQEGIGGGIYLGSDSELIVTRPLFDKCWNETRCNQFIDNVSNGTFSEGGALYINGSNALIRHTFFEGNSANFGTAIYASGFLGNIAELETTHSVFTDNSGSKADNNLMRFQSDVSALLIHNTYSEYNLSDRIFTSSSSLNNIRILSSIILGDVPVFSGNSSVSFNCVIAEDLSTVFPATNAVKAQLPLFVDADFHLRPDSQAIDFCENLISFPGGLDIDGEQIGFDDPTIINTHGSFDAGADESYINEIIFKNGFE